MSDRPEEEDEEDKTWGVVAVADVWIEAIEKRDSQYRWDDRLKSISSQMLESGELDGGE